MKKILVVVLALVMVLSMTACGGSGITGSWKLENMTREGKSAFDEEGVDIISEIGKQGFYLGLKADSDKTGYLNVGQGKMNITWDDKNITLDGQAVPYTISGDKLTISDDKESMTMTLKKMSSDEAKTFENQTEEDLQKAIMSVALAHLAAQSAEEEE